jgi:hypothetical protein
MNTVSEGDTEDFGRPLREVILESVERSDERWTLSIWDRLDRQSWHARPLVTPCERRIGRPE